MREPPKSAGELLERYARGERRFRAAKLRGAKLTRADLRHADLRRACLRDADLYLADLSEADLTGADLRNADVSSADLSSALLSGANLRRATVIDACLTNADLSGADVRHVHFGSSILVGANLHGAKLGGASLTLVHLARANLGNVNLSRVAGLGTVLHFESSALGIDTICKSNGKIPESFLRGCGVPDRFVSYIPSLVSQPIELYSCFISYSTKDEEFAKRLRGRLQQDRLRVWFAPEEMKGGRTLHEQIDEAIRLYDKLLLVLSPHSMTSGWVKREILKARQKEGRQKTRVLFPIRLCSYDDLRDWECLDSDTGLDLAREVRSYFIPDFSSWKDHDAFEASVTRLIRDLQAKGKEAHASPRIE